MYLPYSVAAATAVFAVAATLQRFSLLFIPNHTSHSKYDSDHNNGEYYRCAHIAFPFP